MNRLGTTLAVGMPGLATAPALAATPDNVPAARPTSVVGMPTVMANDKDGNPRPAWLNRNSAGTGPFKPPAFRPAGALIPDANPANFGGAPRMKQALIRHVAEAATRRLPLEPGDVDMAKTLTPDQVAGRAGNNAIRVETYPQAAVHRFRVNTPKRIDAIRALVAAHRPALLATMAATPMTA
jgi:peptide/nickel transport system substrate-binding protein